MSTTGVFVQGASGCKPRMCLLSRFIFRLLGAAWGLVEAMASLAALGGACLAGFGCGAGSGTQAHKHKHFMGIPLPSHYKEVIWDAYVLLGGPTGVVKLKATAVAHLGPKHEHDDFSQKEPQHSFQTVFTLSCC